MLMSKETTAALLLLLASNAEACGSTYYSSTLQSRFTSQSGNTLKVTLAGRISSPYTALPYTSTATDTWDAIEAADEYTSTTIRKIYTRTSSLKTNHDDWNREHLWPQSRGVGDIVAQTDVHAIRASDWNVNSARGNLFFGYCNGCAVGHAEAPLTKKNSDRFEPPDEVKGDIARAIFYLATRYYQDLTLTDNPTQANDFGYLSDLIAWHNNDPVSAEERERNDVVCGFQQNRNPYVDYPCLVGQVWGGSAAKCSSSGGGGGGGGATSAPTSAPGGSGSLFFSQYLEGSSNNKAVQIYNPTRSSVSLSSYSIRIYYNGNTSPGSTITLSGNLAAGGRYTVCHSALSSSGICSTTSGSLTFNGDDAVVLYNGGIVDSVGQVGSDPGSAWTICNSADTTADHTLVRKSSVTTGNRGSWGASDRCNEWEVQGIDTWNAILGRSNVLGSGANEFPVAAVAGIAAAATVVLAVAGVVVWRRHSAEPALHLSSSKSGEDQFASFRIDEKKEESTTVELNV